MHSKGKGAKVRFLVRGGFKKKLSSPFPALIHHLLLTAEYVEYPQLHVISFFT